LDRTWRNGEDKSVNGKTGDARWQWLFVPSIPRRESQGNRQEKISGDKRSGNKKSPLLSKWAFQNLAERTGLEPATPGVTGRYSNQLNYRSRFFTADW
jgi:hypothetical protein